MHCLKRDVPLYCFGLREREIARERLVERERDIERERKKEREKEPNTQTFNVQREGLSERG